MVALDDAEGIAEAAGETTGDAAYDADADVAAAAGDGNGGGPAFFAGVEIAAADEEGIFSFSGVEASACDCWLSTCGLGSVLNFLLSRFSRLAGALPAATAASAFCCAECEAAAETADRVADALRDRRPVRRLVRQLALLATPRRILNVRASLCISYRSLNPLLLRPVRSGCQVQGAGSRCAVLAHSARAIIHRSSAVCARAQIQLRRLQ